MRFRIGALMMLVPCLGFGMPQITGLSISESEKTRYYSADEVGEIVEDITEAAETAIKQAAEEAARAAALVAEQRNAFEIKAVKKKSRKTAAVVGVVCFFVGAVCGGLTTLRVSR
jgi:hypothetical protein